MQDPVTPKSTIYRDEPYKGYWYYKNPKGAYSYYSEKPNLATGEYRYGDEPPYDEEDWNIMRGGTEKLGTPGFPEWTPTIPTIPTTPTTTLPSFDWKKYVLGVPSEMYNRQESDFEGSPIKPPSMLAAQPTPEIGTVTPEKIGRMGQFMASQGIAPGTQYFESRKEEVKEEEEKKKEKKEMTLEDIYRRNMMLYGAQIPLQFRSLFQGIPVIPQMPYATTRAPALMSNVAPATAEARRQMGTAYSIGASLGRFGPAGLAMMPGVIASTVSEGGRMMGEIGTAEAARINAQEAANVEAANATAQARTAAELQRLQLQLGATSAVQTERAKAISNISEVFTRMAKEGMDYYALREGLLSRENAAKVDELWRRAQAGLTQGGGY